MVIRIAAPQALAHDAAAQRIKDLENQLQVMHSNLHAMQSGMQAMQSKLEKLKSQSSQLTQKIEHIQQKEYTEQKASPAAVAQEKNKNNMVVLRMARTITTA